EVHRTRLEFKDLLIDLNERRVVRRDEEIGLTHTEFELLALLASNAGKALSRERILQHIWGQGSQGEIETRVIDVHVRNLRRKIEVEPSRHFYVLAVPGIGYRFTNARADSTQAGSGPPCRTPSGSLGTSVAPSVQPFVALCGVVGAGKTDSRARGKPLLTGAAGSLFPGGGGQVAVEGQERVQVAVQREPLHSP